MSGGVDSSVTALLLARKEYDLSGVFMRNWDTRDESGSDKGCEWEKDWEDVQRVCKHIGMPCEMIDLSREYWTNVFEPALHIWEGGGSPNPDVFCNRCLKFCREIKFGALLNRLSKHHPDSWIATGHYARKGYITQHPTRPQLLRPADTHKDQTYYLSSVPETSLARTLFPLSELIKPEIRNLAREHGLHNAERRDSVGICFVGEKRNFRGFLSNYLTPTPGPIYDVVSGKIIAQHQGLWNFTIGENARLPGLPEKVFVARKNLEDNSIHHEMLYMTTVYVPTFNWIWQDSPPVGLDSPEGIRLKAMHNYRTKAVDCTVTRSDGGLLIIPDEPQRAVTPGQVAVLYDGDWCLGCGIIAEAE
ncbi:5-methylaminomethyl-2-thiouridylate-methyltransferase [Cyathus striatus]|nr:5-methylaminomethyl-2-thiouridylate-methyltransferase [Cyathus striatus]